MADSSFRRAEMQDRQRVSRCPYCVEGGAFKEMKPVEGGDGQRCAHCGHLAVPSDPRFECECAKCIGLRMF